jgi:hypothetical protein
VAEVISARVGEDLLAGVDDMRGEQTRGAWVATLIEGELTDGLAAASPIAGLGPGEPSPGVVCAGFGCWERNTSRIGLRKLPLCPAWAAALEGCTYRREVPPGAARLIHRGPDNPHTALRECRTRGARNGIMEP